MSFQGRIENGLVVPDQPLPLPEGSPVRIELLDSPQSVFWQSPTLDELANRQGIAPPTTVDELLGGWPADELDDGFETAVRTWRGTELES